MQKLKNPLNRRSSVMIFFCCFIAAILQAQNPQLRKWIVPPQQISFPSNSVSALPSSSNAMEYNGQVADHTSNAMHDVNGNLLFFVVDGSIYDKNGFLITDIYNPFTSGKVTGTSEVVIIPVPGNCTQYYIVAGSYDFPNVTVNVGGVPHPYYLTLDLTLPNQNGYGPTILGDVIGANGMYDPTAILLDRPNTTLDFVDPNNSKSSCLHFAVTPLRQPSNDRFLYIEYRIGGKLARFKVTSSGIAYDNYDFILSSAILSAVIRAELELAVLPSGDYRIALPYQDGGNFQEKLYIADYSYATGDQIPNTWLVVDLPMTAKLHGMEFSKDGRYLYVTHTEAPYVQYMDLQTMTTLTPLNPALSAATQILMNPIDFQYSHIELDNNGFMLFARGADISGMNINFNQSPINQNWIQGVIQTGVPINQSVYSVLSSMSDVVSSRQLNDQIDDEVYQVYPPTSPPNQCCLSNTVFTKESYTADISLGANQIWQPGSNPFVNLIGSGNTVTIRTSLIIPAGMTITIRNMRFEFAPRTYDQNNNPIAGANLIVQRGPNTSSTGGRLNLDNSTMTVYSACGRGMWEGMEIRGYSGVAQGTYNASPQGWVKAFNSSRIENAWRGVVVAEVSNPLTQVFPLTVSGTTGGIIQASNSCRFTNNYISALFMSYMTPTNATDNNFSDFNRCIFETTDALWDQNATAPFAHVILWDTKGITFRGNTFYADENTSPYTVAMNNTGYGIWSLNSFFSVYPSQGNVKNEFRNLTYGIAAANIFGTRTVYIDQTNFKNNYRGVYLSGIPWATVTRNNFEVFRWPIQLTQEAYGLYLNYSRGFKVQENDFTYSQQNSPQANAFGIIVNQSNPGRSCGLYDEIYRNTFHSINIGVQAQGNNSELPYAACHANSPSTPNNIGLVMKCNRFYNNMDAYDIRVADYNYANGTVWGNIAYQQGDCTTPSSPANNQYSHDCNYATSDFTIDGTFTSLNPNAVQYSWSSLNQTLPLSPTCVTVPVSNSGVNLGGCTAYSYSPGTSCPSKIVFNPINGSLRSDIAWYDEQIQSQNGILAAGDGSVYYNAIANASPGQAKNTLLAGSPYLSDGVLIAAINRGFPAGILKEIILANSPVSPAVMNALNNITLPNGIRNDINAAQTGVSPRMQVAELLTSYTAQRSFAIDELIRGFLLDTVITSASDSVITALKQYKIPEYRCEVVKTYLDTRDTLSAKIEADSVAMIGGMDNFCMMFNVLLQLDREGQTCFAIASDPIKRGNVEYVAADDSKRVCADANALLQLVFRYQFNEYINSDPGNSASSRNTNHETLTPNLTTPEFALYPNPNDGVFVLDYSVNEADIVHYEIYSLTGSLLKYESLPAGSQKRYVHLIGLAPGTYLIRISVNGVPTRSERMVITE